MLCTYCGKRTKKTKGNIQWASLLIGEVTVPRITRDLCRCGKYWLDSDNARKMHSYVQALEEVAVGKLPVGEFVSGRVAAAILNWSFNKFSRDAKVKNGFIISHVIGGDKYYLRESVIRFQADGDGRFNITEPFYTKSLIA